MKGRRVRLTEYYGISQPVDFVDIDIAGDTKIFLDPFKVARAGFGDPLAREADANIRHYSSLLSAKLLSSDLADVARAHQMLENLNEPRETRLGMSRVGYNGKGVATHHADLVADALRGDLRPLLSIGIFQWLGALPVYVKGISADRMSDMTTAIIRAQLARYTAIQIASHPQFASHPHTLRVHKLKLWDSKREEWVDGQYQLPFAEGHPILLVPRDWTGRNLEVSGDRFYGVSSLGYLQQEYQLNNPGVGKPSKTTLEKQFPNQYPVNLAVTIRAYSNGVRLFDEFLRYVDDKLCNAEDEALRVDAAG